MFLQRVDSQTVLTSPEDATLEMGTLSVVCPSCDTVLGGGRYVTD